MGPEPGGVLGLFLVAFADCFGCRKNPGDDGELPRLLSLTKGQDEYLLGGKMKFSDDFLVGFEERVISRGKADQGVIPVPPPSDLAAVRWAFHDKFPDGLF